MLMFTTTLGCAHVGPARARLGPAGAEAEQRTLAEGIGGLVDLSEPPRVVYEASGANGASEQPRSRAPRLSPGVLLVGTELRSWLPLDYSGEQLELELRNNCSLSFAYSFTSEPAPVANATARRTLAGHTLERQEIAAGQWLHLWDGDRWLGSAMSTIQGGRMDISPSCDTLALSLQLGAPELTTFAIHWELDADKSLRAALAPSAGAGAAVLVELQEQAEPWGAGEQASRVELRLVNYCGAPIAYAFTPSLATSIEQTASLPGHSERRVELPAGWWLRYRALDEDWRGGATTSHAGAVMWIAADCVDFGVADGEFVQPLSP